MGCLERPVALGQLVALSFDNEALPVSFEQAQRRRRREMDGARQGERAGSERIKPVPAESHLKPKLQALRRVRTRGLRQSRAAAEAARQTAAGTRTIW